MDADVEMTAARSLLIVATMSSSSSVVTSFDDVQTPDRPKMLKTVRRHFETYRDAAKVQRNHATLF